MDRRKRRGSLVLALLLALIIPILAACGNQPVASPTAAPQTSAETSAAAQATSAPAAPTSAAPATTSAPAPADTAAPPATTSGGTPGGVLRMGESVWPDTIDPQKTSYSNEIAIEQLIYEGLTRLDKDLKVVPAAAEKWEYNSDATSITFHLREGLKYSDGSRLTAEAFANAARRTLDPRTPGDYQTSLNMLKGADAIIETEVPTDEARLPDLFNALGVKTPDDKTVVFEFSKPTPYFDKLAGIWVMFPVKQDLVDKGGETWYEDPANLIGNGPFIVTKIDKSQKEIEFKANENYWAGRPKLDGVVYKYIDDLAVALQAYKSGEIDVMTPDANDVPTIKADPALSKEFKEYSGSSTWGFAFNLKRPPFDNKKVREAFAYGFDRDSFVRDALKDTFVKTLTWIPQGYPGYDASEKRYDFDPAKGKQLLAEAGYPEGQSLPEIKLSYASNNPAAQGRAEYLVQMYQRTLGVTLALDPVESTTLINLTKDISTYPQVNRVGWGADSPDQQNWLSIYWRTGSGNAENFGYSNPELDKLMDAADIEADPAKRAQLYDQAQKLLIADVPMVIYGNAKNTFLVKSHIRGMDFTAQDSDLPGIITGLMNVTLEK